MNTPESLSRLCTKLIRRGLPADYAERAASEIADHYCDLMSEFEATGLNASQAASEAALRLGDERTLVKETVREYQRRYWCGRWPFITFVLGPIPLMILVCVAISFLAFIICWSLEQMGFQGPAADGVMTTGDYVAKYLMIGILFLAAPAAVMLVLGRLARRAALGPGWICSSAVILAMFVGLWACDFRGDRFNLAMPVDQPLMGFNIPVLFMSWHSIWNWYNHDPVQIAQYLLPLGIAAIMMLRARQLALHAERLVIAGDDFQGGKYEHARVA